MYFEIQNRVGIGFFVLISTVVGIILMIILANIFVGSIVLDAKIMDILTLLALAISLPHNFYIKLLGVLLKKQKRLINMNKEKIDELLKKFSGRIIDLCYEIVDGIKENDFAEQVDIVGYFAKHSVL